MHTCRQTQEHALPSPNVQRQGPGHKSQQSTAALLRCSPLEVWAPWSLKILACGRAFRLTRAWLWLFCWCKEHPLQGMMPCVTCITRKRNCGIRGRWRVRLVTVHLTHLAEGSVTQSLSSMELVAVTSTLLYLAGLFILTWSHLKQTLKSSVKTMTKITLKHTYQKTVPMAVTQRQLQSTMLTDDLCNNSTTKHLDQQQMFWKLSLTENYLENSDCVWLGANIQSKNGLRLILVDLFVLKIKLRERVWLNCVAWQSCKDRGRVPGSLMIFATTTPLNTLISSKCFQIKFD